MANKMDWCRQSTWPQKACKHQTSISIYNAYTGRVYACDQVNILTMGILMNFNFAVHLEPHNKLLFWWCEIAAYDPRDGLP